jgi:hypothetical protein
MRLRLQHL